MLKSISLFSPESSSFFLLAAVLVIGQALRTQVKGMIVFLWPFKLAARKGKGS